MLGLAGILRGAVRFGLEVVPGDPMASHDPGQIALQIGESLRYRSNSRSEGLLFLGDHGHP
jgi:hypothetical protein